METQLTAEVIRGTTTRDRKEAQYRNGRENRGARSHSNKALGKPETEIREKRRHRKTHSGARERTIKTLSTTRAEWNAENTTHTRRTHNEIRTNLEK